jgi:hypothetical protein
MVLQRRSKSGFWGKLWGVVWVTSIFIIVSIQYNRHLLHLIPVVAILALTMKLFSLSSKKVAVKIVSAGIGIMAVGLQIVTSACNDNEESVFHLSSAANELIHAA